MSKYILGIIAIACLQIAYTAYTRIDRSYETAQLLPGPPAIDNEAGPARVPEMNEFTITNTDNQNIPRAPMRWKNVEHSVAKPRKTDRIVPRIVARREPVRPRLRTEYPAMKASDVAEGTPAKKRSSLFAKALPVIKKPYDWAKSLVAIMR